MMIDGESSHGSISRSLANRVESVTADAIDRLRLSRESYFTPQRLAAHIQDNPEMVWQVVGEHQYIIAGQWRHRSEIGQILELTYGHGREVLISKILDVFSARSARLVVVSLDDFSLYLAFYAKFGFVRLDEIIEMERIGRGELPATPAVDVRPMRAEDQSGALAVDVAAFPWLWRNSEEELSWYARQEGVELYVVRDDRQQIVAYAGLTIRDREGHLDRLAVLPDRQGQGYGMALLRYTCEHMLQAGALRLALSTQSNNEVAQRLYRWFGFRRTFRAQKIYGLWLDGGEAVVG